jgi:hypothetical protein
MQAATRLGLAFLLLIAAFVVLVGFAVGALVVAGQAGLAMLVVAAGVAGVAAGVVTWLLVRTEEDEPAIAPPQPQPQPQAQTQPQPQPQPAARLRPIARQPLRVQSMPVAKLPPAYVDAVTRGMRARTSALRGESPRA